MDERDGSVSVDEPVVSRPWTVPAYIFTAFGVWAIGLAVTGGPFARYAAGLLITALVALGVWLRRKGVWIVAIFFSGIEIIGAVLAVLVDDAEPEILWPAAFGIAALVLLVLPATRAWIDPHATSRPGAAGSTSDSGGRLS